ncbi:hypothetical protein TSAR_007565 [Trichomalopsis sarcophagae]|uniref:Uncharacterized protein n=1 Tax=Trichomalopsis sarcophagae TaxID=543379 RepID=A0A232EDM4_9HYME|nr:hypothetical protein TSAR_007565 [Trichomalopsis sarcophagae]
MSMRWDYWFTETYDEEAEKEELEEEVLEILGVDPLASKKLSMRIHPSMQKRWLFWFENGLDKQTKDDLLQKYSNASGLTVPVLNPELALKLQSHAKTRDSIMQSRQNIAEAALNALGAVLTAFIEEKSDIDRKDCLGKLCDASKLIVESMHSQTKSRRALILAGVDKNTRAILESSKPDKALFGEKLGEKIKENQNMEKVASALKKQPNQSTLIPFAQRQNLNGYSLQGKKPFFQNAGQQQGYSQSRFRSRLNFRNGPRNQPFNQNAQFQGQNRFRKGQQK